MPMSSSMTFGRNSCAASSAARPSCTTRVSLPAICSSIASDIAASLAFAARFDRAAVHLHQPLREREADAEAPLRLRVRAIQLHEHVEDLFELVRRNADAVVPYRNDDLIRLRAGGNRDCRSRGR